MAVPDKTVGSTPGRDDPGEGRTARTECRDASPSSLDQVPEPDRTSPAVSSDTRAESNRPWRLRTAGYRVTASGGIAATAGPGVLARASTFRAGGGKGRGSRRAVAAVPPGP